MIVAVDGPAASGKGTLSRRLAARFGFAHLDTGRTYRAVARDMRDAGQDFTNVGDAVRAALALDFATVADETLVDPDIGEGASRIAVMQELRAVLVDRQREFALDAEHGAVLDGRDIGTVVFPDAPVKLFVTANVEERARRRAKEIYGSADGPGYAELLASLRMRDQRDASREASPLRPAPDAHLLDTTLLSIDEAFEAAEALVENALKP